ncbi:MAG: ATP-binding cassette domain-containing protein [Acidimicrobiales bacterium]
MPSTAIDAPVLVVDGLHVRYGHGDGVVAAASDVGFEVGRGEVFGLVGPSGCGSRPPAGRCSASSGRRHRCRRAGSSSRGGPCWGSTTGWRRVRGRRIALVPQHPRSALTPIVAVGRQLDWYLGPHAVDRHAADLRALGLESVVARPRDLPSSFSGGQLQRLVIAIATLGSSPALLLADEPTSTLDPTVAASVLDVLAEARRRTGSAMLFVSHDLAVVAQVCDRVGVMDAGRLVEVGSPLELFEAPRHEVTRRLVDALPTRRRASAPARTSPAGGPPVLELDHLYRYHGRAPGRSGPPSAVVVRAVDDVSLAVAPGELAAVVGESGSGKTTLARVVAGALAPTAGVVRLDGVELSAARSRGDRRRIALVGQHPRSAFNRRRRLGAALDQVQRVHGIGASRAERTDRSAGMLARVGLGAEALGRRPQELSGGELARAALARALLVEPRLLVLDEPTASLDPPVKRAVLDLVDELRRDLGLAVVLITHELDLAWTVADTVSVLDHGRLVASGPLAAVLDGDRHPRVAALLERVPADPRGPGRR